MKPVRANQWITLGWGWSKAQNGIDVSWETKKKKSIMLTGVDTEQHPRNDGCTGHVALLRLESVTDCGETKETDEDDYQSFRSKSSL